MSVVFDWNHWLVIMIKTSEVMCINDHVTFFNAVGITTTTVVVVAILVVCCGRYKVKKVKHVSGTVA